jgi:DNA invertase Pin-like site-specific DNA recombinase
MGFASTADVYSYVRFSTAEQRKGNGFRRQTDLADKWCRENGLKLRDNYSDLGVSAFKGRNVNDGALASFCDLVRQQKIKRGSILLVESLDRLSRQDILIAVSLLLQIINSGVVVVTLADGAVYRGDADPSSQMSQLIMSTALFMRANDESRIKSARKSASWAAKREAAKDGATLGGKTPKWIKTELVKRKSSDGTTREGLGYVVIEAEAQRVRDVFNDYVNGAGIYLLNKKHGIPKATIAWWLSNPVVIGTVTVHHEGQPVELRNHYPAIISPGVWESAQRRKRQRTIARRTGGRSQNVNLFSGLLVDPKSERMAVQRTYGFASYVSPGYVVTQSQLEHVVCLEKLADRFVATRVVGNDAPNPKVAEIDAKIAEYNAKMRADPDMGEEYLSIVQGLKIKRKETVGTPQTVSEEVDYALIEALLSSDNDQKSRLLLRGIVRDTVKKIRLTDVGGLVWYRMVSGEIELTNGDVVPFRYAYCTRRLGHVMCDGTNSYSQFTGDGAGVSFNVKSVTADVKAALDKLPLRKARKKNPAKAV